MKTRNLLHKVTLGILVSLCATVTVQASERPAEGYIMTVYEDLAQGQAILVGSPGAVIDALTATDSDRKLSFAEKVNLCVAYTKVKRIDDATVACDAAMMASHKEAQRIRRMTSKLYANPGDARDVVMLALSNRGVLHALTGEQEKARELFEQALDLPSRRSDSQIRTSAAQNLARLGDKLADNR